MSETAHPLAATLAQIHRLSLDYVPGELDRTAPPRIWLQIDTGGSNDDRDEPWPGADGVTWQDEQIGGLEIEYVRADLAALPGGGADEVALAEVIQDHTGCGDSDSIYAAHAVIQRLQAALPTPNPHEADRNG